MKSHTLKVTLGNCGDNVSAEMAEAILNKLIKAGLGDAAATLASGEGDLESAELAASIAVSAPVVSSADAEFFRQQVAGLKIWGWDTDNDGPYQECDVPGDGHFDSHCCLMKLIEQARAELASDASTNTQETDVFSGHVAFEGATIKVDFSTRKGASAAELDAACMAALAQQAEVEYLCIGSVENAEGSHCMTSSEYVAHGGGICPACRSTEVEGQSVDIDGSSAVQEASCISCDAEWKDHYSLVGFSDLITASDD